MLRWYNCVPIGLVMCALTGSALASATSLTEIFATTGIASSVTNDDHPSDEPLSDAEAMLPSLVLLVSIVLFFIRIRWLLFFWLIAYLILGDLALIAILSVVFLLWTGVTSIFGGTDC